MTKLKILVVEDTYSHLQDAIRVLEEAGVEVVTACTANSGRSELVSGGMAKVDGVITDLFMPDSQYNPNDTGDQPCGLSVAVIAHQIGIPCVICTAGYHHGDKYDWICSLGRKLRWPEMVDCYNDDRNAESQKKDWVKALEVLKEQIEKSKEH